MASPQPTFVTDRIDSWKDIATFLGRAERTVKRWETERGLPVHRLPGAGKSAVFAYRTELTEWLNSVQAKPATEDASPRLKLIETKVSVVPRFGEEAESRPVVVPQPVSASIRRSAALWTGLAAAVLILFAAGLAFGWRQNIRIASTPHHVPTLKAQQLYLQGRFYWSHRTPADLNTAIDYFTQAIVEDPNDAEAYVGLADCYNLLREFGAMPPSVAYPRALAAAQRAVNLDDSSAEAHNSLAFATFWWSWKGASAEREFRRALELNPDFVQGHHWYATYLLALHRLPEALEQFNEAQRLDPSSSAILADKAWALWCAGEKYEAMSLLKQLEQTAPALSSTHEYLGRIAWSNGDYSGAIREWKTDASARNDQNRLAVLNAASDGLAKGGEREAISRQIEAEKPMVDSGGASAYEMAVLYGALDRKAEALASAQMAYDRREGGLLTADPAIASVANDPEYQQIRQHIDSLLQQ